MGSSERKEKTTKARFFVNAAVCVCTGNWGEGPTQGARWVPPINGVGVGLPLSPHNTFLLFSSCPGGKCWEEQEEDLHTFSRIGEKRMAKKNRARKGAKCLSHKKRFANKASPLISTTGEFDFAFLRPFVSPFNQLGRSADDNIFPGKTKQKNPFNFPFGPKWAYFLTTVN